MIYTVGNNKTYSKLFEDYGEVLKQGRGNGYPGGSVWQTRAAAERHLEPGYEVFGVLAEWNLDTCPSGSGDHHYLLRSAEMVRLN